ncbi:MAG: methyltransferase [Isosphaeraceae bacterium]
MLIPTDASPLALDRPDTVRRVREVLDRAGFEESQILKRLGAKEMVELSLEPFDVPLLLRRTRDGDPLATLIRLFLAGVPVPLEDFRRAVEPMDPADWGELGLVELGGDAARRGVMLKPSEGLIIANDGVLPDGRLRRDYVMGVTKSTVSLDSVMIRLPSRATLDLGSGCGYLALRAAAFSQQVMAADLNARAIAMAWLNCQLNGIDNVRPAEGDLFEPANGILFDRIVSNPPFVISPENDLMFRNSGMEGDAICEKIVRAAPAYLAEGGFAQIFCNWVRLAGQDWLERITGWFAGSGCDVWIIHAQTWDPGDYAYDWFPQGDDSIQERFDRWMAYYDRQGIQAIDGGLINLRRRTSGRNWIQVDTDRRLNHPNGTGISVGFAARDLLEGVGGDRGLLDLRLACQPELRLSQRLRPVDSGWSIDQARCVLGDGLRFEGEVNPLVFHLLTLCRGRQPLSAVLEQVAARLGEDPSAIAPAALEAARSLVEQGFLWPADLPIEPTAPGRAGGESRDEHASG